MTEKIKHTYFYELDTEREAAEAEAHLKALNGFTLKGHTEDHRKNVGRIDLVKTVRGKAANS